MQPLGAGEIIDLTDEVEAGKKGHWQRIIQREDVEEGVDSAKEVIVISEVEERSERGIGLISKEERQEEGSGGGGSAPRAPPFQLRKRVEGSVEGGVESGVEGSGGDPSPIQLHVATPAMFDGCVEGGAQGGVNKALTDEEHFAGVVAPCGASSHLQGTKIKGFSGEIPSAERGEGEASGAMEVSGAGSAEADKALFEGGRLEATVEDPPGLDLDLEPHPDPEVDPPKAIRMTELEREEWRQRHEVSSRTSRPWPVLLRPPSSVFSRSLSLDEPYFELLPFFSLKSSHPTPASNPDIISPCDALCDAPCDAPCDATCDAPQVIDAQRKEVARQREELRKRRRQEQEVEARVKARLQGLRSTEVSKGEIDPQDTDCRFRIVPSVRIWPLHLCLPPMP